MTDQTKLGANSYEIATPRTDAELERIQASDCTPKCDSYGHDTSCPVVFPEFQMAAFARQLERELAALKCHRCQRPQGVFNAEGCAMRVGECPFRGPIGGQWLPIEMAPRDGTDILLATIHEDGTHGEIDLGCWGFIEKSDWDGRSVYGWTSNYGRVDEPTHWIPRPLITARIATDGGVKHG